MGGPLHVRLATTTALAALLTLAPTIAVAERARSPEDATVFIRLVGSVHVEYEDANGKQVADVDGVEVGSGSGFFISPDGYVLTNDHVVKKTDTVRISKGLERATYTLNVATIEVCFRPETVRAHAMTSACLPASVTAADPAVDLAVLYVSGPPFPYIALGDSDAITTGLSVDALGFPFGRDVEVGKLGTVRDIVPNVSISTGTISAFRDTEAGERRFLQITNSVNPGNSGGPILDRDGFAVGVLQSRLENATGIGFAIAINAAKDFLESRSLDQSLPVRRLRLGAVQTFEDKGMAMRLPEGLTDTSPFPSHIESDARSAPIALRIDRVLSTWSARQIEETLTGSRTFESLALRAREDRGATSAVDTLLLGSAINAGAQPGRETRMEYAVLDLEAEKLVARYVAPAEWISFNESVLHESLSSLQGRRFAAGDVAAERIAWSASPGSATESGLLVPQGWVPQGGQPLSCTGVPRPGTVVAVSPPNDAGLVLRAAAWPAGDVAPGTAASACSSRRGALGDGSYTVATSWLGVSYLVEGVFVPVGPRVMQLEVLSTEQRSAGARALLAAWVKKASE